MSGPSSRKPSGSSTHSAAHSPSGSPSSRQSQRSLNPPVAAVNIYGAGMSHSNSQGRNSGWQVWGAATPSTRNVSLSSAASDLQPSPGDSNHRGHLGEGWTASRSTTGAWDDANEVPPKKDFSHMESHTSLNLHHTRQRNITVTQAAFSGPRTDDRVVGAKSGQFSPHRYGSLGAEASAPKFPASTSPTRPFGVNVHPGLQSGVHNVVTGASYSGHKSSSAVNEDLSVALRGMAVEDDHNIQQNHQHMASSQSMLHPRGPPMPQPRPYGGYPDYNPYYAVPTGREHYIDFSYGYDAYRGPTDATMYPSPGISGASPGSLYPSAVPQGLHLNAVPDIHRAQQGVFFDYGAAAHPSSQFYYPTHQPVMFSPPTHSPMPVSQLPATLADKKREMQYNIQQHIPSQNVMYGSTSSPHPQAYSAPGLEYTSQIPVMAPRVHYGHNPRHVYPHNIRVARRGGINESSVVLRSPLLDEFRGSKTRKWELRDIFGYIVEFSGDQHGSRFIQQKLESATTEDKQIVFDEIVPHNTLQLIQDLFGNYVIQKLFEHGTQVQKTLLANTMEGHALSLSLQMYGCRVVQKAIEYILPDQQSMFARELEPHVLRCVKDSNGNHVIQKLIERVSPERLSFVNTFYGHVYDLSTHPYGCRVLQRCLEHLPADQTHTLMDELHKYTVNLMQDQFGNYVIQYVLEHGRPQDRALVISKLCGQVLHLARHKFASNVVEKALVCADANSRRMLIDEMMTPKQEGINPIIAMMKDQFANYVLQRALAVADGLQREALINEVRPQLATMRRFSSAYSKHLSSIERLVGNHPGPSHQRVSTPQLAVIPPDSG